MKVRSKTIGVTNEAATEAGASFVLHHATGIGSDSII